MKKNKYFYQAFIYEAEHGITADFEEIFADSAGITGMTNREYKKAQNATIEARNEIFRISKRFYPKWHEACQNNLQYEERERILKEESRENGERFIDYLRRICEKYKEQIKANQN